MPTIAIVEDDFDMNDTHRKLLAQIPHAEIHQAYDTKGARALLTSCECDLVVLDIELEPGSATPRTGLDLLVEFGRKMPILVVTGMPEPNLHEIAIQLKAYEFVRKPLNAVDFLNKVQHALEFRSSDALRESQARESWPRGLRVNPASPPHVLWNDKQVALTMTELTLVYRLAKDQGKTVTYEQLGTAMKSGRSSRVVNQHISAVRDKFAAIEPEFSRIGTDPSRGYYWKSDAN